MKNQIIQQYISRRSRGTSKTQGKKILTAGAVKTKKVSIKNQVASFEVESEYYFNKFYTVLVNNFNEIDRIESSCTCDYDWGGMCKHEVAALYALEKKLGYSSVPTKYRDPSWEPTIFSTYIDESKIRNNLPNKEWTAARQLARQYRAKIIEGTDRDCTATITFRDETNKVHIQKQGLNRLISKCSCAEGNELMCIHRATVLLQLKDKYGSNALELMKDWNEFKNKKLAEYGFSLEDDLNGKFRFLMGRDYPELDVLDDSLMKISEIQKIGGKQHYVAPQNKIITLPNGLQTKPVDDITSIQSSNRKYKKNTTAQKKGEPDKYGIAYLFNFDDADYYPFFSIEPIVGKLSKKTNTITSNIEKFTTYNGGVSLNKLPVITEEDLKAIKIAEELKWNNIGRYGQVHLGIKSSYSFGWGGGYSIKKKDLTDDARQKLGDYLQNKLNQLLALIKNKEVYVQREGTYKSRKLTVNNIDPISVANEYADLHFKVYQEGEFIVLKSYLKIEDSLFLLSQAMLIGGSLILNKGKLYMFKPSSDSPIIQAFINRSIVKVKLSAFPTLLNNVIIPLQNNFTVESDIDFEIDLKEFEVKRQLFLKEAEDFLIIQPLVAYGDKQVEPDEKEMLVYEGNRQLLSLKRKPEEERAYKKFIQALHPTFEEQTEDTNGLYYYLDYEQVLENNWFFDFFETIKKEEDIEIFGFKSLSKFNYNTNRPKIYMDISSGIDWFDIQANVGFGDQKVTLKDVQRALVRNEKFIRLGDGSLGLLPEEWLKKYATLFKMGDVKGDKLKVSKVHFSLIDELYDEIDQEEIQMELLEKRNKLRNFEQIETNLPLPTTVNAKLRPYQEAGFKWFNFLNEFKWGGVLADDMGLGKTLQVITFLAHLKSTAPNFKTNLVVVPTSLIINWEREIDKFCNSLTYKRHHGLDRVRNAEVFNNYDIIITSYGTLSSDIEFFKDYAFNYIVLDESQAIKNPTTKRYKCVRLLKANNRIALTGTPIENNTFDLYAQLNFLNPGMLGSMEFFKQEFSTPIDKYGKQDKVEELKKLIYPFILRRTKQLVAKDLPDKTESILYCEMGRQQRKVYDSFRDFYRIKIMEKINEDGMSKAGMYILEGLMKLRQICDSPQLLKDAEDYGKESVKLKELETHIIEQTPNHKMLIFSQFLGMLSLIKDFLLKEKIKFEYLDGSVSPTNRDKSVKRFQTDNKVRVFLVSLKAGGTGLNLTAADYVYLVDPWWNPAVEQQAIDRTHRIGQKNQVFAYKMICTDSIEEKILNLQNKKKNLAQDLISTEKSFIKKLTKNDIEYLFT